MKILGIESSGLVASVAVIEDDVLLGEYTMNYKKTHSQTLLPILDELTKQIELDLSEIAAIAVSKGPGSYTGLRIGSATAKGLGLALKKDIIPVPTIDGLAYNLFGAKDIVCPIMDARRDQVYTGIYEFVDGKMKVLKEQCVIDIHELISATNALERKVTFLGDGVPVYEDVIKEECQNGYAFAAPHMNRQRAGSIAALGMELFKEGIVESAAMHRPEYLRATQAERERNERLSAN